MRTLALISVLLAGCASKDSPSRPEAAATPPAASTRPEAPTEATAAPRVITTVQTRDHEITVYSGETGLEFTIATGGVVLAQGLDETEFADSFPGLHRHFESAFASDRGTLDARAEITPLP